MSPSPVSIILPTYNEQGNISALLSRISAVTRSSGMTCEIIVVDDGSRDRTLDEARMFPVRIIQRQGKRGLASACAEGFRQAKGRIIVVMDSDLQHPVETILPLVAAVENGADISIASRYRNKDIVRDRDFFHEGISRCCCRLCRLLFKKIRDVKDPMSGFFAFRKDIIEGMDLKPVGYKILLEILILGKHRSLQEIDYTFQKRISGKSKRDMFVAACFLYQLLHLRLRRGRGHSFFR